MKLFIFVVAMCFVAYLIARKGLNKVEDHFDEYDTGPIDLGNVGMLSKTVRHEFTSYNEAGEVNEMTYQSLTAKAEPELTEWFGPEFVPAHEGWYERDYENPEFMKSIFRDYFKNGVWYQSEDCDFDLPDHFKFRGLKHKPE